MSVIAEIRNDLEKGAVQLMVEYRERLRVEAVKLCQDATLAEDLVFRTFEKVLSHAEGFQDGTNLFAWMKTIMTNLYRNDIKRPVVRGTTAADAAEIEQCAGVDWSTDEEILRNSDSEAIREAIQGLGPIYKEPLLKRYYDGLTLKEIAEIMRLPIGTVSRRLHVAHHLLAGKLSAEFGRLKKPLAVLVGALVLVGAAFASWTTGFFGLLPDREPEAPASVQSASEQTVEETVLTNDIYQTTKEDTQMKTNGMTMAAAVVAGVTVLGAHADGIVGEIMPDDALEFAARQTENGYLYVDELGRTNAVEIFLSSGSWTIPSGVTAFDYFVVGGGGSGGSRWGGGGGAGGVIAGTVLSVKGFISRELSITVGVGGAPVTGQKVGKAGSPSEIRATVGSGEVPLVRALGGGAGWRSNTDITTDYNNDGGSGGGGSYNNTAGGKANAGSFYSADWITGEMFANDGGLYSNNMDYKGGGGGGAGAPGAAVADGYAGGDGIETFITGKSAWFAGGGGGASGNGSAMTIGGKGGGGAGSGNVSAGAGMPNTGSGGGGLGENGSNRYSGAGGSGIVIIRHLAVPERTGPVPQHELTVRETKGGVVSGPESGSYDEGSILVLVAEPEPKYEFRSWMVNGVSVGQTPRLDLEMTSDMIVVANFDKLPKSYEWGWYDARDGKTAIVAFTNESMGVISWTLPDGVKSFDYVVVGGGGSGGSRWGGGGGAGGVITGMVSLVEGFVSRELSITVGAGGAPVTGQSVGNAGSPSEIVATVGSEEVSLVQALGGGAGWKSNITFTPDFNNDGGSGGGGSYSNLAGGKANAGSVYSAGWITGVMFAKEGGLGSNEMDYKGGGGGGAGKAGARFDMDAAGGDGIETFITGKSLWLAGGGGGANGNGSSTAPGGKGGGGSSAGSMAAESGMANTGSGGGGLGQEGNYYSGAGGSGIVILRLTLRKRGFAVILR